MSIKPGEYVDLLKASSLKFKQVTGEPEGIREALLHKHEDGSYSHILRIDKGVEIPGPVTHDFYEEAYYIEGEMLNTKTDGKIMGGMYVFHAPHEEHGPFRCLKECLLVEFRYYR